MYVRLEELYTMGITGMGVAEERTHGQTDTRGENPLEGVVELEGRSKARSSAIVGEVRVYQGSFC